MLRWSVSCPPLVCLRRPAPLLVPHASMLASPGDPVWEAVVASVVVSPPGAEGREVTEGEEAEEEGEEEAREA